MPPQRTGHVTDNCVQHAHATRPALLPRRTTRRSPWRFGPPSTPHPRPLALAHVSVTSLLRPA
eukprot:3219430-Prymnesium_polylepis.1